ncbi:15199_t:CDS:1, partial [Dentiscutata heterogama]
DWELVGDIITVLLVYSVRLETKSRCRSVETFKFEQFFLIVK